MSKEIVFTDMAAIAEEKELLSEEISDSTWQVVEYETEPYSGRLILSTARGRIKPLHLTLGLFGWYRIYVAFVNIDRPFINLQLDGDVSYTTVAGTMRYVPWQSWETVEEIFFKCAELKGGRLAVTHPEGYKNQVSSLLWIRCVPMEEREVAAYQKSRERGPYKIHAHIDTDFMGLDNMKTPRDALNRIHPLAGTDVTMLSQEISFAREMMTDESAERYVPRIPANKDRNRTFTENTKLCDTIYPMMIEYAREQDIRLHAAMRMQMANFAFPADMPAFRMPFADAHPEWYVKTRDGRTVKVLSYAYPEVRAYRIAELERAYRLGFPGLTLIFIRGITVGFEEPILQRVAEKHPGVDGRRLPASDERLNSSWCEAMTAFMRELRARLDAIAEEEGRERCNLHVISHYTLSHDRQVGLDIEGWAKEGLIDGVTVGMMAHEERLSGILGEDGLIDIEKYTAESRREFMVKRLFEMNLDLMLQGVKEHEALARDTGIETYYSVNWEGCDPTVYAREARAIYEAGATGIHLWDTNGRTIDPPGWEVTSKLGHPAYTDPDFVAAEYERNRRYFKTVRLGDNDLTYVNNNWGG